MRIQFLLLSIVALFVSTNSLSGQVTVQWDKPVPQTAVAPSVVTVGNTPYITYRLANGSYGFYGGDEMAILHQENVRKDLELLDDQFQEISRIRERFNNKLSDAKKAARQDPKRAKDLSITIKRIRENQKAEISEVLLPHQLDRLKQVRQQIQMKAMGTANALTAGPLAKELEITPEQVKELAELKKKLQEQIKAKTEELKAEAKQEMYKTLTSEQRRKLKKLLGDDFENQSKGK